MASVEETAVIEKVHVRSTHLPVHCSNDGPDGRTVLRPQATSHLSERMRQQYARDEGGRM